MKTSFRIIPVVVLLVVALALVLGSAQAQGDNPIYEQVKVLAPEVISVRPHDPAAYTQGLLFYDGFLYESTGRQGASTLRKVDPATGEVLQSINVPQEFFAEGLERVDNTLIQLTWQTQVAFIYDLETFEKTGEYQYEGEGWGLCSDGRYLYMSDGSPFIDLRDRQTFEEIFSGMVTIQGKPVERLNELECVGDYIYANIWKTDFIVQFDKSNGVVVAVIDAAGLLTDEERAQLKEPDQDVLNGIVYLPDSDTFLITGKHWPKMFEVRFVERQ
ncbi:MAG: glutaminyl-peptide cyclotransferase [Chloroflexi bacterium]|nr:glutaminyl-peptide cyclotransferase [Chloroflexota bacterium]